MQHCMFKQVDVFTQKPFLGNPVAVVIGAEGLEADQMQRIAAWTNLSETTFVLPPASPQADYRLRIFSPKQELPFAGHPTIGSAHAVIESGFAVPREGKLCQECAAGLIELSVENTAAGKRILLKAPDPQISAVDEHIARLLSGALGTNGALPHPPVRIDVGVVWLIAELSDSESVAALRPDMGALLEISTAARTVGITVFGKSDDRISQLHVRSFAPALGVAEDPVCGSGNACVGAYLLHTGRIDAYGRDLTARQGMQIGRDGQVTVRIAGNSIGIGGYAVTCVDGTLRMQ
jgi:PhzF family phenazine biosynthesis protein